MTLRCTLRCGHVGVWRKGWERPQWRDRGIRCPVCGDLDKPKAVRRSE
jgi:hypothetical protein